MGGGRRISWNDPLLTESLIFVFIEKAFQTDLGTDEPTDRQTDGQMDGQDNDTGHPMLVMQCRQSKFYME